TVIFPVVAAGETTAVIDMSSFTTKLVAFTPLNLTSVAPMKCAPVIATDVPTGPLVGAKLVMVATGGVMVKFIELTTVPPGVVTEIGPVVAPLGTVMLI